MNLYIYRWLEWTWMYVLLRWPNDMLPPFSIRLSITSPTCTDQPFQLKRRLNPHDLQCTMPTDANALAQGRWKTSLFTVLRNILRLLRGRQWLLLLLLAFLWRRFHRPGQRSALLASAASGRNSKSRPEKKKGSKDAAKKVSSGKTVVLGPWLDDFACFHLKELEFTTCKNHHNTKMQTPRQHATS